MKIDEAYSTLGLEPGHSTDDLKKAFRQQALKWHPDKNKNSAESTEQFQKVQAAYERLEAEYSDDSGEDLYDDGYSDDEDYFDDDDYFDFFFGAPPPFEFFEAFFRSARFRHGGGGGRGFSSGHQSHHSSYRPEPPPETPEEKKLRKERERLQKEQEKEWERERIRTEISQEAERLDKEATERQQRGVRAWLRQTGRPAVSLRSDTSVDLKLIHKGLTVSELPGTLMSRVEMRRSSDATWSRSVEVGKGTKKVVMDGLDPGTEYLVRVCRFNRTTDGAESWGEWSSETKCSTTGGAEEGAAPREEERQEAVAAGSGRSRRCRSSSGRQEAASGAVAEMEQELLRAAAEEEAERRRREEEEEAARRKAEKGQRRKQQQHEKQQKQQQEEKEAWSRSLGGKSRKKKTKNGSNSGSSGGFEGAAASSSSPLASGEQHHAEAAAAPGGGAQARGGGAGGPQLQPEGLSEEEALAKAIAESLALQEQEEEALARAVSESLALQRQEEEEAWAAARNSYQVPSVAGRVDVQEVEEDDDDGDMPGLESAEQPIPFGFHCSPADFLPVPVPVTASPHQAHPGPQGPLPFAPPLRPPPPPSSAAAPSPFGPSVAVDPMPQRHQHGNGSKDSRHYLQQQQQPQQHPGLPDMFPSTIDPPVEPVIAKPPRRAPGDRAPGQPCRRPRAPPNGAAAAYSATTGTDPASSSSFSAFEAPSARPRYMPPSLGSKGPEASGGGLGLGFEAAAPVDPVKQPPPPAFVPFPETLLHQQKRRQPLRVRPGNSPTGAHPSSGLCKFFNTKKGCRNGEGCRFVHNLGQQ